MVNARFVTIVLAAACLASRSTASEPPSQTMLMEKRPVLLPSGRSINMVCEGQGSPTIIFENGLGGNLLHWQKVEPALSALTRSCFYDRAGYGFSDPAEGTRTALAAVDDLHTLLRSAGIKQPVVLVGHSLGGLIATLYTDLYPDQVAGLVLIDPSFAGQGDSTRSPAGKMDDQASYDQIQADNLRCASLAWKGKLTVANTQDCFVAAPNRTATEKTFLLKQYLRPYRYEANFSELYNMNASSPGRDVNSQEEEESARTFGRMPLIVLTAGQSDTSDPGEQRRWKEGHDKLAARSTYGRSIIVAGAGHYIQVDRPDAVIAAVKEVVEKLRRSSVPSLTALKAEMNKPSAPDLGAGAQPAPIGPARVQRP